MKRRIGLWALGIAAVVLFVAATSDDGGESTQPKERPGASVQDQGQAGLTRLRSVLEGAGHETIVLDRAPSAADLDTSGTVVLLEPGPIEEDDIGALRDFAEGGGRLVFGGYAGLDGYEALTGTSVDRESVGPTDAHPYVPAPETVDVSAVDLVGQGSFASTGSALPLAGGTDGRTVLAVSSQGKGRVVLLADPSPLQNGGIARADNAQLGLDVAGNPDRPVFFAERVRYASSTGLGSLPGRWQVAFAGLVLAGLVLIASRFRRNGPPEPASRELPPPRRRFVDAVGTALARTRTPAAAEPVRVEARRRLLAASPGGFDAGPGEVARAGAAAGLDRTEWEALAAPIADEKQVLAAGTALAKLKEARR